MSLPKVEGLLESSRRGRVLGRMGVFGALDEDRDMRLCGYEASNR